jgi:hypothetical protein
MVGRRLPELQAWLNRDGPPVNCVFIKFAKI